MWLATELIQKRWFS